MYIKKVNNWYFLLWMRTKFKQYQYLILKWTKTPALLFFRASDNHYNCWKAGGQPLSKTSTEVGATPRGCPNTLTSIYHLTSKFDHFRQKTLQNLPQTPSKAQVLREVEGSPLIIVVISWNKDPFLAGFTNGGPFYWESSVCPEFIRSLPRVYPSLSPRDATLTRNRGGAAHLTCNRGVRAYLLLSLPSMLADLFFCRGSASNMLHLNWQYPFCAAK